MGGPLSFEMVVLEDRDRLLKTVFLGDRELVGVRVRQFSCTLGT
jgi:hypothetical protein